MRGFVDGEYQDGEVRGLMFFAGTRGYGKTTELLRVVESGDGPAVLMDPLAKHKLKRSRSISQPGELKEYFRRPRGRVIYQPNCGDMDEHFRAVCRLVLAAGQCIFAVDEMDMFCGPQWGDKRMPPELYNIANYGRHSQVSMPFTAREPMRVARGLTSSALEMRLFQMNEPDYLKYFLGFIGIDANKLPSLPKYHYLRWFKDGAPSQVFCAGKPKNIF
jgi:hypothetical protein